MAQDLGRGLAAGSRRFLGGHDLDGIGSEPGKIGAVVGIDPLACAPLGGDEMEGVVDHSTGETERCDPFNCGGIVARGQWQDGQVACKVLAGEIRGARGIAVRVA